MQGDEVSIFSETPDWKALFLIKIKIKQTQTAQRRNIMQSSRTFIRKSGPIADVKKSALINDQKKPPRIVLKKRGSE